MTTPTSPHDRLEQLPLAWRPGMSLRRLPDGTVVGRFYGAELSSVFQPIVDVVSGRRIGYEAFVRSHAAGEVSLSPWGLFSLVADDDTLVGLDRLCRTLHVLNDPREREDELLFLNVHGRLLAAVTEDHGRAFRTVLDVLGRNPHSIVIETPESACSEPAMLAVVLSNYRLNGFRVAANVSSLGDATVLLGQLRPDFLKVDARHVSAGANSRRLHRQAREHGAGIVFTRVSRLEELDALRRLPDLLVQGYALGDPRPAVSLAAREADAEHPPSAGRRPRRLAVDHPPHGIGRDLADVVPVAHPELDARAVEAALAQRGVRPPFP